MQDRLAVLFQELADTLSVPAPYFPWNSSIAADSSDMNSLRGRP